MGRGYVIGVPPCRVTPERSSLRRETRSPLIEGNLASQGATPQRQGCNVKA